jgi:type I restriction enzyme S subunit
MKTKNTYSEPKLRFSGYSDKWIFFNLEDHCERISVGLATEVAPYYREKGVPIVRNLNIKAGYFDDTKMLYLCEKFSQDNLSKATKGLDVLTVRTGSNLGQTCVLPERFNNCQTFTTLITTPKQEQLDSYFLSIHMNSFIGVTEFARLQVGGGKGNMNTSNLKKYRIAIPSISEQQKIVDFLSTVDKKTGLLKEKYSLLKQYKKGVMQKLFSQEIRFKDKNGCNFPDWINTKLGNVFERVTQKNKEDNQNVLTISAQRGLINQQKYFNKSVSAKDVTGYYLLQKGDFAYNKSYSKGYPMGAIKRLNNYDEGVVSTLYICFKSHDEQHDAFWEQYFEAGLLNREISKIAQEGARNHGLLNVSVVEFFRDITVHAPSEKEQVRLAEFLGALDKKLELVSQQIEQTQTFKKGLLQQMFV